MGILDTGPGTFGLVYASLVPGQVQLKAHDHQGTFVEWQNDCTGTEPIVTVDVNRDMECVAVFECRDPQGMLISLNNPPSAPRLFLEDSTGTEIDPPFIDGGDADPTNDYYDVALGSQDITAVAESEENFPFFYVDRQVRIGETPGLETTESVPEPDGTYRFMSRDIDVVGDLYGAAVEAEVCGYRSAVSIMRYGQPLP